MLFKVRLYKINVKDKKNILKQLSIMFKCKIKNKLKKKKNKLKKKKKKLFKYKI